MRRFMAVSTALAAAVFILSTAEVGSAAITSAAKLQSEALTIGQMPAGWRVANSSGDSGVGCLANLLEPKGVTQIHNAQVYYLGSGGLPLFDEKLATYPSPSAAYKKIAATISSCRIVKGAFKGYPVTGTVAPMSFSHYGNASVAYAMSLTSVHITVKYDYLIVRKGNVVLGILEGNIPSVSVSQFRGLVVKALAKIK